MAGLGPLVQRLPHTANRIQASQREPPLLLLFLVGFQLGFPLLLLLRRLRIRWAARERFLGW